MCTTFLPSVEALQFGEGKTPQLRIQAAALNATIITVRGFTKHGLFFVTFTTSADRAFSSVSVFLPDLPIAIQVENGTSASRGADCYVDIGITLAGFSVYKMVTGYLPNTHTIGWPPGKMERFLEGAGQTRSVLGTDPAANTEISETVPTNAKWKFKSFKFTLVTDGNAATRTVSIIIDDGTNIMFQKAFGVTQAASLTRNYEVVAGDNPDDTAFDVNNIAHVYVPPGVMELFQTGRIRTTTTNIQAGDNYGAPRMRLNEWIED